MPSYAITVRPNLIQQQVSLSQVVTGPIRDAVSKAHQPRDTKSRGYKIPDGSSWDTLFRDTTSFHQRDLVTRYNSNILTEIIELGINKNF
jgi:hypothetical protein